MISRTPQHCVILLHIHTEVSVMGEDKTKAPNSDYHNHKDAPLVAARQAEVARD